MWCNRLGLNFCNFLLMPACYFRYKLGFTFSFPTIQHSINSADLANWTKVMFLSD